VLQRFMPYRGPAGLPRYDRFLVAVRATALLVAVLTGSMIGWKVIGPAWFGPGVLSRLFGLVVGNLLAALLVIALDAAAWISGERQEDWANARDQQRQASQQAAARKAAPASVRPTPENLAAVRQAKGRTAARKAAPAAAPPVAPPMPPSAVIPGIVDDGPPAPPRWEPSRGLLEATRGVVTAAGPNGLDREAIGDALVTTGQDPTGEELGIVLATLTDPGRGLTSVDLGRPYYERRWYAADQVKVTRELLDAIVKVVEAAPGMIDPLMIRGGLRDAGLEPSAPSLARALRVLAKQGALIEVDGQYVRAVAA
jgi:hypothetical protein